MRSVGLPVLPALLALCAAGCHKTECWQHCTDSTELRVELPPGVAPEEIVISDGSFVCNFDVGSIRCWADQLAGDYTVVVEAPGYPSQTLDYTLAVDDGRCSCGVYPIILDVSW